MHKEEKSEEMLGKTRKIVGNRQKEREREEPTSQDFFSKELTEQNDNEMQRAREERR